MYKRMATVQMSCEYNLLISQAKSLSYQIGDLTLINGR